MRRGRRYRMGRMSRALIRPWHVLGVMGRGATRPSSSENEPKSQHAAPYRHARMGCGRFHFARSLHRRDDELGAFLDARGPARGHRLGLGVKAHGVGPVLIEVAEARTLPAADGVI